MFDLGPFRVLTGFLVLSLAGCWESRKSPSEYSQEGLRLSQSATRSELSPLNVVPQNESRASGSVVTTLDKDHSIGIAIGAKNLSSSVSGVYFHLAPAGENGAVVGDLMASKLYMQTVKSTLDMQATWKPSSAEWQAAKSGQLYIDIHTAKYPNGEVRAQIVPAPGW